MLRCGQMILAQALVCSQLGRAWRWRAEGGQPEDYHRILHCFLDRKDSCYSVHQMAQMGVGEGKSVGEWYGPNTVAQVLNKLALFDDWNSLAVYVSMDNTVVIEDIKKQCRQASRGSRLRPRPCGWGEPFTSGETPEQACLHTHGNRATMCPHSQSQSRSDWRPLLLIIPLRLGINHINPVYIQALKECFKIPQSCGVLGGKPNLAYYFIGFVGEELIYLDPHTTQSAVESEAGSGVDDQSYHCLRSPCRMKITNLDPHTTQSAVESEAGSGVDDQSYHCLRSPRHMKITNLDPHTTQSAVESEAGSGVDDQSYQCLRSPRRMKITNLDPSVALVFFCKSEDDFDSWCNLVQQEIQMKRNLRMFELVENHPPHWPPFVPPTKPEVQTTGAEFIESSDKLFESEEEFEILNV
ncbi:cysteine protease ATG4A-like [Oncorhynchus keta]|uniref:cysteine protease ATG4A-like n=1 Tax=Oncorhynchus keta TaxID=8018 RepID=UPI00227D64F4|nr:cysteine protease ATG4A-like [Oncorhynchus keta]